MKKYSTEAIPLIENFCIWLQEQKKSVNTIKTYKRELEIVSRVASREGDRTRSIKESRYSVLYLLFRKPKKEHHNDR